MAKYQKSRSEILLNWGISRGHVVMPNSQDLQGENLSVENLNFKMEKSDLDQISNIN